MDNDDALVGRIYSRREALITAARAGVALAAGGMLGRRARAQAAATTQPRLPLVASPVVTEGPFFVDEKLNRSNLLAGTTRASVINGTPLALAFTVYKMSGKTIAPLKDATVDVWHADALGVYSDEANPMNHENTSKQTWLRGYQVTDANGLAAFNTIFPGWYSGRTPHIHFKVRQLKDGKATAEFTSQVFFQEKDADRIYTAPAYSSTRGQRDTTNRSDDIFSERLPDGSTAGSHLLLDLQNAADPKGYTSAFAIVLTEENMHSQRGHGFSGPRGAGGPPGGPGGPGGPPPFGPDDMGW